jgi:crossover junction endodeoxyribonuclease RuvC
MLILGIDPGSRHTGFGLIESSGDRLRTIDCGRIRCQTSDPLERRLVHLTTELEGVIERFEPQLAVLETPFHGVNSRSLIVLAQARGALLATLARSGIEIVEYSPAEVKTALTGNGRADKQQVAKMVRLLLSLGSRKLSNDATDALAMAICAAHRWKMDRLG